MQKIFFLVLTLSSVYNYNLKDKITDSFPQKDNRLDCIHSILASNLLLDN